MDNLGKNFRARFVQLPKSAYKQAPIWKRASALIIDILVLNMVVFSPFRNFFIGFAEGLSFTELQSVFIPDNIYASLVFISILSLLYFALLQNYAQQTIGMMVMKLYVVPPTGFFRCIVRNLFILPFFPFNLLWIVEPLYLAFKGRRVLEQLTGTNTVEVENG
ncbi:RDD family protein [Nanoarchaeota archaeon]